MLSFIKKTASMLYVAYNNAMFSIALKFYKEPPTKSMLNRLHVDYIHYGHGIHESNHMLPHTHLWDTLEVETIPLTEEQKTMYIYIMPDHHFKAFVENGANVRYHARGLENESAEHEICRIEQRYYKIKSKAAKQYSLSALLCAIASFLVFYFHM